MGMNTTYGPYPRLRLVLTPKRLWLNLRNEKLIAIAMNFFMKEIDDEIDDIVYVIITDSSHNEGI